MGAITRTRQLPECVSKLFACNVNGYERVFVSTVLSRNRHDTTERLLTVTLNTKESNDQESIYQREKRTHLKQRHRDENTTSRKQKGQFLSQVIGQMAVQNKTFIRTYMQRHTMTEILSNSRSNAFERSVKVLLGLVVVGVEFKSILRGHNPRL